MILSIFGGGGSSYSISNYSVAKFVSSGTTSFAARATQIAQPKDDDSEKSSTKVDVTSMPDNAVDARAKLTERYGDLDTTSAKYKDDIEAFRKEIFDDLKFDRATLFQIANNDNGYFSNEEIKAAELVMEEQLENALNKSDPDAEPTADNYLSLLEYLEKESSEEEKATFEWAVNKASAQANYKRLSNGKENDLFSDDPVVSLLTKAHEDLFDAQKTNPDAKLESMSAYDSAQYQWERNNNTYDAYTSPDAWWK
ncbi:hypothetical protein [Pseudovibrio sp. SCP19]|uniref:hypothetical protein n=1 Tax=Pseudovibrio sp. SCP19 TaxID=3141374 RepID=UPI0033385665